MYLILFATKYAVYYISRYLLLMTSQSATAHVYFAAVLGADSIFHGTGRLVRRNGRSQRLITSVDADIIRLIFRAFQARCWRAIWVSPAAARLPFLMSIDDIQLSIYGFMGNYVFLECWR